MSRIINYPQEVYDLLNEHMSANTLEEYKDYFELYSDEYGYRETWYFVINFVKKLAHYDANTLDVHLFTDFVMAVTKDKYGRRTEFLRDVAIACEEYAYNR